VVVKRLLARREQKQVVSHSGVCLDGKKECTRVLRVYIFSSLRLNCDECQAVVRVTSDSLSCAGGEAVSSHEDTVTGLIHQTLTRDEKVLLLYDSLLQRVYIRPCIR
jgi:hypothetical protein